MLKLNKINSIGIKFNPSITEEEEAELGNRAKFFAEKRFALLINRWDYSDLREFARK